MTIHLTRDLESLHRDLLSMCALAEEIINEAVDQLLAPDLERARALTKRDDEVDRWDVQIEEECLKVLALHQPVAGDLRRISTMLKLIGELERVADLGVNIAERACGLLDGPKLVVPDKLKEMSRLSVGMLNRSIDAYVKMDSELARTVLDDDDHVDNLNRDIIQDLQQQMCTDHHLVPSALHLFSASRHIERVADHATNISEDVVYLVEGEIIRHRGQFAGGDNEAAD